MEIDKWVIEPEAKCLFCADKTSTEPTHEHQENTAETKPNEQSFSEHVQSIVEADPEQMLGTVLLKSE